MPRGGDEPRGAGWTDHWVDYAALQSVAVRTVAVRSGARWKIAAPLKPYGFPRLNTSLALSLGTTPAIGDAIDMDSEVSKTWVCVHSPNLIIYINR